MSSELDFNLLEDSVYEDIRNFYTNDQRFLAQFKKLKQEVEKNESFVKMVKSIY